MPKPFAAFDVDGTIFKSGLFEKLVDACIADGLFARKPFEQAFALRRRWQRHNTEAAYIVYVRHLVDALIAEMAGTDVAWFDKVTKAMIAQHAVRKFGFPRQLIRRLKDTHYIVAISGSPDILVRPFLKDLPIDAMYGSQYEVRGGRFTGKALNVANKASIITGLMKDGSVARSGSVAVGDTIGDSPMLELADTPIMFNASKTLLAYGKPRHWLRVNEVKDQITCLAFDEKADQYIERPASKLLT